ncbi:MAG: hypothetical protein WC716_03240 [Chitinophagaceae bacterium]|jgi:hypothetical protein
MKTLLCALPLLWILQAKAQTNADSIQSRKNMGTVYFYKGKMVKPKQLLEIMEPNPAAFTKMKRAKTNFDVGTVFGFAGGFAIGWSIGSLISRNEMDWRFVGAGAGLIGISIPFSIGYNKRTTKAVKLYNGAFYCSRQVLFSLIFIVRQARLDWQLNFSLTGNAAF